ncbi:hypothetical protein Vafri_11826 [Volvox africanus]|uniref:5'-3' exonuclease domain-containing protein n=1 Tax=Volvox africanus TaxID=51714 RepID=A0A8J4B903_9CHLO|nr:hypothetical protein Vafri_11826 [Volvox africanus]
MHLTTWMRSIGGILSSSMRPLTLYSVTISYYGPLTTQTSRFVRNIKPAAAGTLHDSQGSRYSSNAKSIYCDHQEKSRLGAPSFRALPSTATGSATCPPRFRSSKKTSSSLTSLAPAKPRSRSGTSILEPIEQPQLTEASTTTLVVDNITSSDITVVSAPKPRTRRSKTAAAEDVALKPSPLPSSADSNEGVITQQLYATAVRRATATQPSPASEETVCRTATTAGILLIVDGNYLANRSFFGYGRGRGLSTSTGTPTSVTYGVMKVLQAALRRVRPTSLAVVFDPPGPTFRSAVSLIDPVAAGSRGMAAAELVRQGRLDWKELASRLLNLPPVIAEMQAAAAAEAAAAPASYLHPCGSFLPPRPPLTPHGDPLQMQRPALRSPMSTAAAMLAAALGPERAELLGLTDLAGVAAGPAAAAALEPPYKSGRASKGGEFYSDLSNLQADDLAGLLVQHAVRKGMAVRILSGDRDLMQLVSDPWDVAMLYPATSLLKSPSSIPPSASPSGATSLSAATAAAASEGLAVTTPPPPHRSRLRGSGRAADFPFVELREADVVSALGVAPALVPDYKALTGDASDRLPGVAGIGPKTAVELLASYGNMAGVHCAAAVPASKLSSKRRATLQDALPASQYTLTMARVLGSPGAAALPDGVMSEQHFERLQLRGFDPELVHRAILDLEMQSLARGVHRGGELWTLLRGGREAVITEGCRWST